MREEEEAIRLIELWRAGDDEAASALYRRFFEQLRQKVSGQLATRYQQQFEPEDVLQSTFGTVFRRLSAGEFQFDDDEDVWKLLVTVALNKLRRRVRKLNADRRDVRRQRRGHEHFDELLAEQLRTTPGKHEVVAFQDLMVEIAELLPDDEQAVLQLRLEGNSQTEIAEVLQITDRTVRRRWDRIRERLQTVFDGYPGK